MGMFNMAMWYRVVVVSDPSPKLLFELGRLFSYRKKAQSSLPSGVMQESTVGPQQDTGIICQRSSRFGQRLTVRPGITPILTGDRWGG